MPEEEKNDSPQSAETKPAEEASVPLPTKRGSESIKTLRDEGDKIKLNEKE